MKEPNNTPHNTIAIPGWQLRASLDTSQTRDVSRLMEALHTAKIPADINPRTDTLQAVLASPEVAFHAAEAIRQDFPTVLMPPARDMVNQGMQASHRVWMQFRTPRDPRFADTGAAGVPFLQEDIRRIENAARTAPHNAEIEIDRAVFRANEMLVHHYKDRFLGRNANPETGPPEFGWVVAAHAGKHALDIAVTLAADGIQHRLSRAIIETPDGKPITSVIVYAGSMDEAERVAHIISRDHQTKLQDSPPPDPHTGVAARYQFARGVEGHFVPYSTDDIIIDRQRGYQHGLPALHEIPNKTAEPEHAVILGKIQRTADTFRDAYGTYFAGNAPASDSQRTSPRRSAQGETLSR